MNRLEYIMPTPVIYTNTGAVGVIHIHSNEIQKSVLWSCFVSELTKIVYNVFSILFSIVYVTRTILHGRLIQHSGMWFQKTVSGELLLYYNSFAHGSRDVSTFI